MYDVTEDVSLHHITSQRKRPAISNSDCSMKQKVSDCSFILTLESIFSYKSYISFQNKSKAALRYMILALTLAPICSGYKSVLVLIILQILGMWI